MLSRFLLALSILVFNSNSLGTLVKISSEEICIVKTIDNSATNAF